MSASEPSREGIAFSAVKMMAANEALEREMKHWAILLFCGLLGLFQFFLGLKHRLKTMPARFCRTLEGR